MSSRGSGRAKRGRIASFVHKISPSGRGRHGRSDTSGDQADDMDENVSLSSPGHGSSSAAVGEASEPSDKVLLDRNVDDENRYVISISRSGQFVYGGSPNPARWFGDKCFNSYTFEQHFPTAKKISKEVYGIWYNQFRQGFQLRHLGRSSHSHLHTPTLNSSFWCKIGTRRKSMTCTRSGKVTGCHRLTARQVYGQGSIHTGGSLNFSETWDRLIKKYGPDADAAIAYLVTHTARAPDGSLKWSTPYHQNIFETYERRSREEAIEEGSMDPQSTERPKFRGSLWKSIVLEDKRQKGDRLPGFGEHGAGFFDMPLTSRSSQCFFSSTSQNSERETFDARVRDEVERQVQRRLEVERQEREAETRQLLDSQKEMENKLEKVMAFMQQQQLQQQQQPPSGNASASSVGQFLNLDSGRGSGNGSGSGRGSRNAGRGSSGCGSSARGSGGRGH